MSVWALVIVVPGVLVSVTDLAERWFGASAALAANVAHLTETTNTLSVKINSLADKTIVDGVLIRLGRDEDQWSDVKTAVKVQDAGLKNLQDTIRDLRNQPASAPAATYRRTDH